MNIVTKIALSLSLITLIAQPVRAASYTNRAKKAGKIAWHAGQTVIGSTVLFNYLLLYVYRPERRNTFCRAFRERNAQPIVSYIAANATLIISAPTILYCGIKGLKKEICPDFNPIAWMKNKLCKKTKQPA